MYACRDEKGVGGNNNVGNYCNPKMEEFIKQMLVENDTGKRDQLIKAAYQLGQEQEWAYVPAAPAGARLGRLEEGEGGAARRQPDPVLLVPQGLTRRISTEPQGPGKTRPFSCLPAIAEPPRGLCTLRAT